MRTRTRVGITVASALALAVTTYGDAWSIGEPGPGPHPWGVAILAAYGLAIVGVFFVNRWWALVPAVVPNAVYLYLEYLTDYVEPWQGESFRPNGPGWFVGLLVFGIALRVAVLAIGLLARWGWDASRRLYLSRTTPRRSDR